MRRGVRADFVAFVLGVVRVSGVQRFDLPLVQDVLDLLLADVGAEGGFFRDVIAGLFMTRFSCSHMSPDYITTRESGCAALVEALLPSASKRELRLICPEFS